MRKTVLVICLLFLLSSCSYRQEPHSSGPSTRDIDVESFGKDIFSAFIDSISFVMLEENEQSYFTSISKIRIINDKIFVFDKIGKNCLLGFNMEGNFLYSFGEKGNSANEYLRLWDFDVDHDYVYLYDRVKNKMFYYDHNGGLVKKRNMEIVGDGFTVISNGNFLFSLEKGENMKKLCVTDSLFKINECLLYYRDDELDDKITEDLFFCSDSIIFYNKPVSDSIYTISYSGKLQGCYKLNYKRSGVPQEISGSYEKIIENDGKKKYIFMYNCPLTSNGYIVGSVFNKGNKATLIIDTKTNKCYINDWVKNVKISNIILPVYATSQYIVGWMDYEVYNVASDKNLFSPEMVEHLQKGGKILIFYYLKNKQ